jgi:hypothetical protein
MSCIFNEIANSQMNRMLVKQIIPMVEIRFTEFDTTHPRRCELMRPKKKINGLAGFGGQASPTRSEPSKGSRPTVATATSTAAGIRLDSWERDRNVFEDTNKCR